jgi:hypothetical protein
VDGGDFTTVFLKGDFLLSVHVFDVLTETRNGLVELTLSLEPLVSLILVVAVEIINIFVELVTSSVALFF